MAGEMSQSEVTAEAYPDLFTLQAELTASGIPSFPHAFDQYQGPYLSVPGVCKVWYHEDSMPEYPLFVIERGGMPPRNHFDFIGATSVVKATSSTLTHGIYTLDQAVNQIKRSVHYGR